MNQPESRFSKHAFEEATGQAAGHGNGATGNEEKRVRVTLTRSPIGLESSQRRTCEALGLKRINRSRVHDNTPAIRGMLDKVRQVVTVEMVSSSGGNEEAVRAGS